MGCMMLLTVEHYCSDVLDRGVVQALHCSGLRLRVVPCGEMGRAADIGALQFCSKLAASWTCCEMIQTGAAPTSKLHCISSTPPMQLHACTQMPSPLRGGEERVAAAAAAAHCCTALQHLGHVESREWPALGPQRLQPTYLPIRSTVDSMVDSNWSAQALVSIH